MAQTSKGQAEVSPDPPPAPQILTDVIDKVVQVAQAERVTLRDVLHAVGQAGFAPVLLLPALAVATPLSGIPFFSSLMGLVIFLISAQMLMRRDQLWLPAWVLERSVKGATVASAFQKLKPIARWLESRVHRRLRLLARRPLIFVPQLLCLISGAVMPLLEFIPFSSSAVGAGVAILALGMLARDGVVTLLGIVPFAVTGWIVTSAIAA